jgi:hypothetical protein
MPRKNCGGIGDFTADNRSSRTSIRPNSIAKNDRLKNASLDCSDLDATTAEPDFETDDLFQTKAKTSWLK